MGNQLDGDLSEEVIQLKKSHGRKYLPNHCLQVLHEKWKKPPGELISFYRCLPPGVKFLKENPDNLYWWPDVVFLPHTERTIVTSMGALLDRPGYAPMAACPRVHGLLYTLNYDDTLECRVIKGTQTPALPNISVHPNGNMLTWAGEGGINIMHLTNCSRTRHSSPLGCTFYCTAVTQNGGYLAAMSRCSDCIKLETFLLGDSSFLIQAAINCHWICPGFKTDLRNQVRFECIFSPDGVYIACGSSHGQLFVVTRYELKPVCIIVPGIPQQPDVILANERCFDFDPRFLNRYLAFCDTGNAVHLFDLDDKSVVKGYHFQAEAAIQSIKFSPTGHILAIGLSSGIINIVDPDSVEIRYTLDLTRSDPDSQMVPNAQGKRPDLLHLSYSSTGALLATCATDGIIRIWQLRPEMSLTALCRRAILQYVPMRQVFRLPLPVKLMKELLQWPEN